MEDLSHDTATEVRAFLTAVKEVATGHDAGTALPVLLLALARLQNAGARLGAVVDVVPQERFEPDAGPDPDLDAVRAGLRSLLAGLDDYVDVTDPVVSGELVQGSLTDDLATVAADLQHGLDHYQQGRAIEALWWWQFSYLSSWGDRCAVAVRVVHGLLAHVRLDVDAETAMEAELAALHAPAHDEE